MDFVSEPYHFMAVLAAGILAGAGNTVAGGGTTLSFPILVWVGLPEQIANATNTLGLLAGSGGGAWSYRGRIRGQKGWKMLWVPALFGGALGAVLLLVLPPDWFAMAAPWLVIASAGLVAAGPLIGRHFSGLAPGERHMGTSLAALFLVAIYGGYFGAGIGILVLVTLRFVDIADLHDANGLKNLLVTGIKGVAAVGFVMSGVVVWSVALIMIVGSTLGGWGAGHLIQKVDQDELRWVVVAIGIAMGVIMMLG